MPPAPKFVSVSVACCLCVTSLVVEGQEVSGPDARWVRVYGWVQIGEKLAEIEQWPLALGSYLEAAVQLKILMASAPNFEPEMVNYRFGWLTNEITRVKKKLVGNEHDIMAKYLDFVSSFEQGQSERFNNKFEKALDTLNYTKVLLDDLIAERPEEFKMAMMAQHTMLLDSIDWLNSQLNYRAALLAPPVIVDKSYLGTTQFINENDLPAEAPPATMSGDLFPSTVVNAVVARFEKKSGATSSLRPAGEGVISPLREDKLPTFRASSKEDPTPMTIE